MLLRRVHDPFNKVRNWNDEHAQIRVPFTRCYEVLNRPWHYPMALSISLSQHDVSAPVNPSPSKSILPFSFGWWLFPPILTRSEVSALYDRLLSSFDDSLTGAPLEAAIWSWFKSFFSCSSLSRHSFSNDLILSCKLAIVGAVLSSYISREEKSRE